MTFITSSLFYFGLLVVICGPVFFLARRTRRFHLAKRFLQAAAVGGLMCGIVAAGQARLVSQCEAEGNTACFDAGADGMKIMVVAGFIGASLLWTYFLATD